MKMTAKVRAVAAALITFGSLVGGAYGQAAGNLWGDPGVVWDLTSWDHTQVTSAAGQNFDVWGDGSLVVNVKATGTWSNAALNTTNYSSFGFNSYGMPADTQVFDFSFVSGGPQYVSIWTGSTDEYEIVGFSGDTFSPGALTFFPATATHSGHYSYTAPGAPGTVEYIGSPTISNGGTGYASQWFDGSNLVGGFRTSLRYLDQPTEAGGQNKFRFASSQVPEPSSALLAAISGLLFLLRRR